ncbi:DUF6265 family protein [Nannocystis sp.]|uniref:DUF6265 family protein n=1 Tax=Nannocystis sp. TaxID=1962667 RepID=UPI0025DBA623|nr:DUF6265 family protein [Nannocystis sp.]MBK7827707.1 hypothetical protein [Nannocystis sp.]
MRRLAPIALLLACHPGVPAAPRTCTGDITDAGFLAGAWQHRDGEHRSEEQWSEPAAGTMLGLGRTIVGARTEFFEFLRIEARAHNLVLIAQPRGGPPVEFQLDHCGPDELRFANPNHDFPQQLHYRRDGDALHIEVAGPDPRGGWIGHESTLHRTRGPRTPP